MKNADYYKALSSNDIKSVCSTLIFLPIDGREKAEERLSKGENPYGTEEPKWDNRTYWTRWRFEGIHLQWVWWKNALSLGKKFA